MQKWRFLTPLTLAVLLAAGSFSSARAQEKSTNSIGAGAGTYTVLRTLHGFSDSNEVIGLATNAEGLIFGTANFGGPQPPEIIGGVVIPPVPNGGHTPGTRFRLDRQGALTLIPAPLPADGGPASSTAGLLLDPAGNLVFSSPFGGAFQLGGVFKQDPFSAVLTTLDSFEGLGANNTPLDGAVPAVNVVSDAKGNLYGTTVFGDGKSPALDDACLVFVRGCGIVYKLDANTGREKILHSFAFTDGWIGLGIALDDAGNIYGVTKDGGDTNCKDGFEVQGCGVVFRLHQSGNFTILHSFSHRFVSPIVQPPPGVPPPGAEVQGDHPSIIVSDADGNVFGATPAGGNFGLGVVFKIDTAGNFTVLHHFAGPIDGFDPQGLILEDGKLIGANALGGDIMNCGFGNGCGTIFSFDVRTGDFTVLHTFSNIEEGAAPIAITLDGDGNLIGANAFGGNLADPDPNCFASGCGTIFKLSLGESE